MGGSPKLILCKCKTGVSFGHCLCRYFPSDKQINITYFALAIEMLFHLKYSCFLIFNAREVNLYKISNYTK